MTYSRALYLILLGCGSIACSTPTVAATAVQLPRASGQRPLVDHHAHLISPTSAAIINGPRLAAIEVGADIRQLLADRAARWENKTALQSLYTEDAIVLIEQSPKSGLFRGDRVVAEFLSDRFAGPYRLTPVSATVDQSVAHVTGYYTRGAGPETKHIGYFQLGLVKEPKGGWKIKSEMPTFPTEPPQEPVLADQLVAALDAAGVGKAVVLSTAAAVGGRWLDIYRQQRTAASRRALVEAENDWTRNQARRYPDRLVSFCAFDPLEPYALEELRRCKKTGHLGLKLHFLEAEVDLGNPGHEAKLRRLFAEANRLRFPIIAHVANDELGPEKAAANARILLDRIVAVAPHISIQIAHLWGGEPSRKEP